MLSQGTCGNIRRISFRSYGVQVVDMLAESYKTVFVAEDVNFNRFIRLSRFPGTMLALDLINPILTRFGEAFVWNWQGKVVGTGSVMRAYIHDPSVWVLFNFAVSRVQVMRLGGVVRMRSLLRLAVSHAAKHGAKQINAYVRIDNKPILSICRAEGFEEVEELSYYVLRHDKIACAKEKVKLLKNIRLVKQKQTIKYLPVRWIASNILGTKRETYLVHGDKNVLGTILTSVPKGEALPYRINAISNNDNSFEEIRWLILLAISLTPNQIEKTILELTTGKGEIESMMEQYSLSPAMKRKLLIRSL